MQCKHTRRGKPVTQCRRNYMLALLVEDEQVFASMLKFTTDFFPGHIPQAFQSTLQCATDEYIKRN